MLVVLVSRFFSIFGSNTVYVGCNFGYFFGGSGVLYGLLGSWEIPRAKNAELYDVFPKFAITDVHHACLNISLSSVTQGKHFPTN